MLRSEHYRSQPGTTASSLDRRVSGQQEKWAEGERANRVKLVGWPALPTASLSQALFFV
jgi:hypothetical protein